MKAGEAGEVTVNLTMWDSQMDHGDVWLMTEGIFTGEGINVQMTPGVAVGDDGLAYTATFTNTYGGASGPTPVLIAAYTSDTGSEPHPAGHLACARVRRSTGYRFLIAIARAARRRHGPIHIMIVKSGNQACRASYHFSL